MAVNIAAAVSPVRTPFLIRIDVVSCKKERAVR
jgi:hypothetical protein